MEHENNIVYDSYYLASLFIKDGKPITQLQIQKLMYFFEAYYMNVKNVDKLYDCNFNAWMFGPVAIPLYKEYKNFGEFSIELTEEKIKIGEQISKDKKKMLEEIYSIFGRLNANQLVNLTHLEGSPWYKKWLENNKRVVSGPASYIDKIETKKWFKENFITDEA